MTQNQRADLAGDLAYGKPPTDEGGNAPLIGGVLYVVWGLLIGVASFVVWLRAASIVDLPHFVGGIGYWLSVLALGWGLTFVCAPKIAATPGALSIGNRTAMAVWLGAGAFLLIYWIALTVLHGKFEPVGVQPYTLFGTMVPVAFGVYGIAFFATATAARLNWMRGFAAAAWIFSVASLFYFGAQTQLLVAAIGSVTCAALPGFLLMRREPSDAV